MKTIYFIKSIAFVISFILKVFSAPFRLINRCLKQLLKSCKTFLPNGGKKGESLRYSNRGKILTWMYSFTTKVIRSIYWILYRIWRNLYWKCYYACLKMHRWFNKNIYVEVFFAFLQNYMAVSSNKIECCSIISVEKYAKINGNVRLEIIEPVQLREVCIPEMFECCKEKIESYIAPDIYVAQVPNVSVIGGTNAVITGRYLLNDAAANDKDHRIDIRYSSIKAATKYVALVEKGDGNIDIEKGINLIGAASYNYYHLVVEILSKLAFVDKNIDYSEYPILVDEIVLKIPQFKDALSCMNRGKHTLIPVKKGQQYNIKTAVLPSSNVWMPTNVYKKNLFKNSDYLMSQTVLTNIRSAVKLYEDTPPFRKIFISRKNTKTVRLKNEEAIREIFKKNGFEIIYTEDLSFQEQIECFGQAACVIAATGAALTNIIFCQPETIVGCIVPEEFHFYMYSTIAHLLQLVPFFLNGRVIEETAYIATDTFILDEDYTRRYIAKLSERLKLNES